MKDVLPLFSFSQCDSNPYTALTWGLSSEADMHQITNDKWSEVGGKFVLNWFNGSLHRLFVFLNFALACLFVWATNCSRVNLFIDCNIIFDLWLCTQGDHLTWISTILSLPLFLFSGSQIFFLKWRISKLYYLFGMKIGTQVLSSVAGRCYKWPN